MDYVFNYTSNVVKLDIVRAGKEVTLNVLPKCRAYLKSYDIVPEKSRRQANLNFKVSEDKYQKTETLADKEEKNSIEEKVEEVEESYPDED